MGCDDVLQVAAFQCLQPFMGTLLAFLVLGEQPSAWDLGAIGVVAGLILVVRDPKGDGSGPPFSSRV
jgi:drug/metabolite transporter (DMT)-like permease